MRFSKYFIPTQKENSSDAKIKSHILMIKSGMIKQEASGIYSWLPVGFRIIQKIVKVIEKFHELAGVNQLQIVYEECREYHPQCKQDRHHLLDICRLLL